MTEKLDSNHEPEQLLIAPTGFYFLNDGRDSKSHLIPKAVCSISLFITAKCGKQIENIDKALMSSQAFESEACSACLLAS